MKVHTGQSSRFHGGQIDRIERGFIELGHEVTPYISDADLIYQNNPWFDSVVSDRRRGALKPGSKVIFNVLDIPVHIPDFPVEHLTRQLREADAVTSISQWTADQVREKCGIESWVIYNPIKPVKFDPAKRNQSYPRFASIGRRSDPNKHVALWTHALRGLGVPIEEVLLVGNEGGWGMYAGVLNDENLDTVYNSVDFVLCTGRVEGLNLPVIEAMATRAVPVVVNHLTVLEELFPESRFPEYYRVEPTPVSVAKFLVHLVSDESGERLSDLKQRLYEHFIAEWQEKTSPAGVARRILNVYNSL